MVAKIFSHTDQLTRYLAHQMVGQLPDHFSNLDPASFTNGNWGVDDEDDDDDDEDDEEGVGFRGPVHIADRPNSP